ncbi:unnamed protein product (macronuclear) [Paramecium tetraurelia]|uniref:C2 NT-type domain-containing protein n=1 Tax=Paramecium tetraurelia TaxID=5888 RepID=A0BH90_PARTE|nr:uncharacterized protein GSPATT00028942001 [Paramecium tetraurelia]CAK57907.1 unnamed protein product [Paramecium tetraurelia]|eukprot:XP_001425305.1 hypothetical protein (macronuclear) [Paramecium tetraurelia strain d4-2]
MLQLQLEVRTIQFYINSMTEFCSIQFIHNLSSTPLKSLLRCRCRDIQEIREKIDLNIQYFDKGNLRLQIYDGQIIFGEATINLGFYIENSLPVIIDNITIQSRYDQEAYVEMSLGWNQFEQTQTKEIQQANPIREQPLFIKLSQQTANRVPNEIDHQIENRLINAPSLEQIYILQSKQEYIDKKSIEQQKQLEDEKIEDITKAHLETTNSRRFQTPKDSKLAKKQKIQKSSGLLEHYKTQIHSKSTYSDSKQAAREQGLRIVQKSPNIFDQKAKIRIHSHQNEENDAIKGTAKQQRNCNKNAAPIEDQGKNSQKYLEAGFFTSRQLEIDLKEYKQVSIQQLLNENQQMQYQIERLSLENQDLKEQLIKSEATFNLLSETYTNLRNEYKKVQIKSYDSSNNTFIINKEYEFIKKELEQKQKQIEFNQKETELGKIELEITKRENIQLQIDLEQIRKEVFNKKIENSELLKDIQEKQVKINTLEEQLLNQQVNQQLSQDLQLQEYSEEQNNYHLQQKMNSMQIYRIEIDNYYQELIQTRQKLLIQESCGKQQSEFLEERQQINSQLQQEINQLKQKLIESNKEIKSKTLEIEILKTQINSHLQIPDNQNLDLTSLINQQSTLYTNLKQENQSLVHQNRKDQVKLESLQKELGIYKNIVKLSEQRQQSLEQEIQQLEKAVLNGKQNMADVINAVLECGGPTLAEAVERFLITRRSSKIS